MKMYPHITSIHTNIKFANSIVVKNLEEHIFVTGDNGTGKTALINALELALTGTAYDLGGRDKARSGTLLAELIPSGENSLYSYVTFSDGTEASWVMERGKRAVHNPPPVEATFLMPEIMGALAGSKLVSARFILRYFSGDATYPVGETGALVKSTDFLEREEKVRKRVSTWKAEVKALSAALTTFGATSETAVQQSQKSIQLRAMKTLLSFQVNKNLCACGVCGSPGDIAVFGARLAKVEAALATLGEGFLPEHVVTLQNALDEAQSFLDKAEAELKELQGVLVLHARKLLEERVVIWVSEALGQPIGVKETKSNFLVGFVEEDTESYVHPLLSGAEMMRLAAAIAQVIINLGAEGFYPEVGSPLGIPILVTPDRGLDLKTLKSLLLNLRELPVTTIVQSPSQPRGRPTAGWTRVILHSDYVEVNRDGTQEQVQKRVG